jgi:hypothetical protein
VREVKNPIHSRPSEPILAPGKLYLAFDLSGHAIAGCGTISPGADGLDDVPISDWTAAFQNERTVDVTVGADDEAYFHLTTQGHWDYQWIGGG